jgi:hypothetical protein
VVTSVAASRWTLIQRKRAATHSLRASGGAKLDALVAGMTERAVVADLARRNQVKTSRANSGRLRTCQRALKTPNLQPSMVVSEILPVSQCRLQRWLVWRVVRPGLDLARILL